MSTIIHVCQSVRGALRWSKAELRRNARSIKRSDGSPMTPEEVREYFLDELARGHEVIPIGSCDDFDFKTGCRGHRVEEPTS